MEMQDICQKEFYKVQTMMKCSPLPMEVAEDKRDLEEDEQTAAVILLSQ